MPAMPDSKVNAGSLAAPGVRVLVVAVERQRVPTMLADVSTAVGRSRELLHGMLVERCGVSADRLDVLVSPTRAELGAGLRRSAGAVSAHGALVVFYVGHAELDRRSRLYLSTADSSGVASRLAEESFSYTELNTVLDEARIGSAAIVLDCCHAGDAYRFFTTSRTDALSPAVYRGRYVLAATGTGLAGASSESGATGLTDSFARFITQGDPRLPESLTFADCFAHVARDLPTRGLPRPYQFAADEAARLVVAPNPALERVGQQPIEPPDQAVPPPYMGLAAYSVEDGHRFHGRDAETARLVAAVLDSHRRGSPLLVVGASGSGKTSLLGAGVEASFARSQPGSDGNRVDWHCIRITPGPDQPLHALAKVSEGHADTDLAHRLLVANPAEYPSVLRQLPVGGRYLLVVDQFEELYRAGVSDGEREAFITALLAAARPGHDAPPPAAVVIGLRADYLGDFGEHAGLVMTARHAVTVTAMSDAEIRTVVVEPARQVGLTVEPEFVDRIVTDVRAGGRGAAAGGHHPGGVLPLLSYALHMSYLRREGRRLTARSYVRTGGLWQAVATAADDAYERLAALPHGQAIARLLLLAMVALGDGVDDSRRPLNLSAPTHGLRRFSGDAVAAVVEQLVATRIVTRDGPYLMFTHEAVLRSWPRLRSWIVEQRADLLAYQKISEDAHRWERSNREPGAVLRGGPLARAEELLAREPVTSWFGATEHAFVHAGQRQRTRLKRRVTAVIGVLSLLLALALIASFVAVQQQREAEQQRSSAESRQLAAQADLQGEDDLQLAMLLSATALKRDDTDEARASLLRQIQRNTTLERFLPTSGKPINGVAFSSDRKTVAATTVDSKEITVWNANAGEIAYTLRSDAILTSPAFSPDGRNLAAGSGDPFDQSGGGNVTIWDMATRSARTLRGISGLGNPTFSPDGTVLATSGRDTTSSDFRNGTVVLWDVSTLKPIAVLHTDSWPRVIQFSPDGSTLAVENGADIYLWDIATNLQVGVLSGEHTRGVLDLDFSPDGSKILSGGHDALAVLWDVANLKSFRSWPLGSDARSVTYSPDNKQFAIGGADGQIMLWNAQTLQQETISAGGHIDEINAIAFSVDGKRLVSGSNDGRLILWNPGRTTRLHVDALPHAVTEQSRGVPAISEDHKLIATSTGNDVLLWDATSSAMIAVLRAAGDHPTFSPDARTVATTTSSQTLIWEVATGRLMKKLTRASAPDPDSPGSLYSPRGDLLATVDGSRVVLWNTDTYERNKSLEFDDEEPIRSLAFSPDGHSIAAGGFGFRPIVVWNPANGTKSAQIPTHSNLPVTMLSFSSDSETLAWSSLASANTTLGGQFHIRSWNLATRSERVLTPQLAKRLTFGKDDGILAFDNPESGVTLWSPRLDGPIGTLTDPQTRGNTTLSAPVFSKDGSILLTTSADGDVLIWDMDLASWTNTLCTVAGRDLTFAEWEAVLPERSYEPTCT